MVTRPHNQRTPEPRQFSFRLPWPLRAVVAVAIVLMIAGLVAIGNLLRHDSRVAKCQTEPEIAHLLGPSLESFSVGDQSSGAPLQFLGLHGAPGTATNSSRAVLHGGSWFWYGYLVFYEGDTIVAIYRLNTG